MPSHRHHHRPPWFDAEDMAQEVALARLEAERTGFDPEAAASKAARHYLHSERRRSRLEPPASRVFPEDRGAEAVGLTDNRLAWVAEAHRVVSLSPPKAVTPGQRRRFLRNQAIFALTLAGMPQRTLADLFDLPHSRIAAILVEMREKTQIA